MWVPWRKTWGSPGATTYKMITRNVQGIANWMPQRRAINKSFLSALSRHHWASLLSTLWHCSRFVRCFIRDLWHWESHKSSDQSHNFVPNTLLCQSQFCACHNFVPITILCQSQTVITVRYLGKMCLAQNCDWHNIVFGTKLWLAQNCDWHKIMIGTKLAIEVTKLWQKHLSQNKWPHPLTKRVFETAVNLFRTEEAQET